MSPEGLVFGSVCSGIEAASCAWHPLGWRAAWLSEIERFPSAVLAHHYPDVPNHGDMTRFKEWPDANIDVLVGGTPCQSFSVAGLRKGLADPRGNLMLVYLAIADRYRPRWLVWENVPGVLSSAGGRDFGSFLGGLGELGYGFAYRVLDAQFYGLAQRRKRVFVVGCLGDWRRAAAVLFERHSLSGDSAPSRSQGEGIAASPALRARANSSHRADSQAYVAGTLGSSHGNVRADEAWTGRLIAPDVARCIATREGTSQDYETTTMVAHSLRADGFDASEDGTGRGTPLVPVVAPSIVSNGDAHSGFRDEKGLIAFDLAQITSKANRTRVSPELPSSTLNAAGQMHCAAAMQVRRLTPRECERLQGFADDYTLIDYRGKPTADGPRYKALGNSMAVPCMAYIGRRIQLVDELTNG